MTDRIRLLGAALLAVATALGAALWLVTAGSPPRPAGLSAALLLFATCFAGWNGAVLCVGGAAMFGPARRRPARRADRAVPD
jgi:hypothetical protein